MSSSYSPAPELGKEPEVQAFPYTEATASAGSRAPESGAGAVGGEGAGLSGEAYSAREGEVREAGRQEGRAEAQAAFEARLEAIRESVAAAIAAFAGERTGYYRQVEGEVVQLALSMARKILHREAQIDPSLLAGLARVALEKIEAGTKVVVRVHPHQVSECRSYFARHLEAQSVPEVVEDAALEMDRCVLQTSLGTTELGTEVQLKEIERGLFDLLAQRPGKDA